MQRLNVAIGAILCVLIWALSYFVFHAAEGWPRGLWILAGVVAFCLCAFAWKPKPPTSAYSCALPLLLFVPAASTPALLWAVGLLALGFVAKAAVDVLTHQAGNNIFEQWGAWFDARTSWLNKYQPGSWPAAPRPRFWLSTTVLVALTDFWHAADSVYLTAYLVGAMLLGAWLGPAGALPWVLAVVGVKAAGGGVFQACYRWFRISK